MFLAFYNQKLWVKIPNNSKKSHLKLAIATCFDFVKLFKSFKTNQSKIISGTFLGTSLLLTACAQVNESIIDGASAPDDIAAISEETNIALGEAAVEADNNLATEVIKRRYSTEVARGNASILTTKSKTLPVLAKTSSDIKQEGPILSAKDARVETLNLDDAIKAALNFNVAVGRAGEQLTRSESAKANSLLGYAPRVQGVGEYQRVRQDVVDSDNAVFQSGEANFDVVNARVEATQPILDFGRIFSVRVADLDVKVAEIAYIAAAQRTAFEAASAYSRALEAQARFDGVKKRLHLLKKQRVLEGRAIASGLSTQSAVDLIAVEIGRTEIELLEINAAFSAARTDLGRLIGQPVQKVASVKIPNSVIRSVGVGPAEGYLTKALRDNPEMNRLRLASLRQRTDYERQVAEDYAPRVEAFGRVEYEDRSGSRFGGGSRTFDGTVGVRLTVPIFNANGQGYISREAESDARQALLDEVNLRRALETEIRSLHLELAENRRLIYQAQSALSSANKLIASSKRRVSSGQGVPVEVLRQELQVARAREWVRRSKYTFIRNWARFSFLTGERFSL